MVFSLFLFRCIYFFSLSCVCLLFSPHLQWVASSMIAYIMCITAADIAKERMHVCANEWHFTFCQCMHTPIHRPMRASMFNVYEMCSRDRKLCNVENKKNIYPMPMTISYCGIYFILWYDMIWYGINNVYRGVDHTTTMCGRRIKPYVTGCFMCSFFKNDARASLMASFTYPAADWTEILYRIISDKWRPNSPAISTSIW